MGITPLYSHSPPLHPPPTARFYPAPIRYDRVEPPLYYCVLSDFSERVPVTLSRTLLSLKAKRPEGVIILSETQTLESGSLIDSIVPLPHSRSLRQLWCQICVKLLFLQEPNGEKSKYTLCSDEIEKTASHKARSGILAPTRAKIIYVLLKARPEMKS